MSAQNTLEELEFILSDIGAPPLIESVTRPQRSATTAQPMSPQDMVYAEYLKKASTLDFSDIQQLKAIYTSGICIIGGSKESRK